MKNYEIKGGDRSLVEEITNAEFQHALVEYSRYRGSVDHEILQKVAGMFQHEREKSSLNRSTLLALGASQLIVGFVIGVIISMLAIFIFDGQIVAFLK